jgi:hypothetical protein
VICKHIEQKTGRNLKGMVGAKQGLATKASVVILQTRLDGTLVYNTLTASGVPYRRAS